MPRHWPSSLTHRVPRTYVRPVRGRLWYAVQTNPRCERRAQMGLEQAGYQVVLPLERATVRHARRLVEKDRPLMPGYVLVGQTASQAEREGFDVIRTTDGVRRVVRAAGAIRPVQSGVVAALSALALQPAIPPDGGAVYQPGEAVRVLAGPWADFIGRIVAAPRKDRFLVLLKLFGRDHQVTVPVDRLARARA